MVYLIKSDVLIELRLQKNSQQCLAIYVFLWAPIIVRRQKGSLVASLVG